MSISNTNHTTNLMINPDLEVVKKFRQRYCIHLRVVNTSGSASFVLFENAASDFLGVSADNLRSSILNTGGNLDNYLDKLLEFLGKSCIFKVLVNLQNINYFQPCVITVPKICKDDAILTTFSTKHEINTGKLGINGSTDHADCKTPSLPPLKKSKKARQYTSKASHAPEKKKLLEIEMGSPSDVKIRLRKSLPE
ncbi:hypothetical protein PIB30_012762 [Stylosanthes scabra]|uniref:Replication factor A C-terminal domain-containing protein n=1 Tax=Stylosanthes scabra TaxID=79078 RepID=A0ABU6S677_9FABA|nr:hypothetical protein [Stylosanthes scabra]